MLKCLGFDDRWSLWIKKTVCSNSISIMVNGSSTEMFEYKRGLKQEDPLAPFLFLVFAEGLIGLFNMAVECDVFKILKWANDMAFSLLLYVNDSVNMKEPCVVNLWTLKAIFRSFELMSSLCLFPQE